MTVVSAAALAGVLAEQSQALMSLAGIVVKQREVLQGGRLEALQDLFKEQQHLGFAAEVLENQRNSMAFALAAQLGCEPKISAICERLSESESSLLREKAGTLDKSVRRLQAEMKILSGRIDVTQRLNGMMLCEWRRLQGMYPSQPGVDFRG